VGPKVAKLKSPSSKAALKRVGHLRDFARTGPRDEQAPTRNDEALASLGQARLRLVKSPEGSFCYWSHIAPGGTHAKASKAVAISLDDEEELACMAQFSAEVLSP
jgi:hypothetical protein